MKSWSNLKINDSFRIYSSWAFWNTPNMSDLSDYSMRYSKFKYNQIFASDFSQRLSSCVLNMPSNENLKASICSLVTPLSSHVIKFIVHSIILIWQAMFSCPAWFWLYCILDWETCYNLLNQCYYEVLKLITFMRWTALDINFGDSLPSWRPQHKDSLL